MIDGVPTNINEQWSAGEILNDTVLYDRIEVLRGSDGLMSGFGNPSAVVNMVRKRASSRDFPVEIAARRPGDPPALVADVSRIRATLDWRPQFEALDTIVAHALAWERRLPGRQERVSA